MVDLQYDNALPIGGRQVMWLCQCDCNNMIIVLAQNLALGHTRSCGCLSNEQRFNHFFKHGESKPRTREYSTWTGMISRCYRPQVNGYEHYGGRGIQVCFRWRQDFRNFLEDMGRCPPGMTLDRKDPDGHYEPENCQWASFTQQTRNRRKEIALPCPSGCSGTVWRFCPQCGKPLIKSGKE